MSALLDKCLVGEHGVGMWHYWLPNSAPEISTWKPSVMGNSA